MAEKLASPKVYASRLSRLGRRLASQLIESKDAVITNYQLYLLVCGAYDQPKGLFLRHDTPDREDFAKARRNLIKSNILEKDVDYFGTYRILQNADMLADDICCTVDPLCYISHMSAMQWYGLSDRRPKELALTTPSLELSAEFRNQIMARDFGEDWRSRDDIVTITIPRHPIKVRGRKIWVHKTMHPGQSVRIRNLHSARVGTIGQTFLDMVIEPGACGGMNHVLDVWEKYARTYLDDIVESVEKASKSIWKVRAGYILDEVLGVRDDRIDAWLKFTQRGGSRRLDPSKEYCEPYSEKWMISVHV